MRLFVLLVVTPLLVTGCQTAAISDLEEDKVNVVANGSPLDPPPEAVLAEANRGCEIHDRTPIPVSAFYMPNNGIIGTTQYLFACKR